MFPPELVVDDTGIIPKRNMKQMEKTSSADESPTFVSIFKTYCRETSLHCFKYLVRSRGRRYERLFWSVQLVVVYSLVALALWKQLLYFYNTPVLITFQPKPTLVSSIPLPAVTLCPDMQVRKSAFNLTSKISNAENFTSTDMELLFLTTTFCDIVFDTQNMSSDFSSEVIKDFSKAHNSYSSCNDFIVAGECQRKRIEDPCFYFQPSFSPQGACFSFNLLPPDQLFRSAYYEQVNALYDDPFNGHESVWSTEDGYKEGLKWSRPSPDGSPPWSSPESSVTTYYLFLLKVPTELFDPICFGGKGFHGYLHNPAELPSTEHTAFYVKPGNQLNLQIKPKVFTIEETLKTWSTSSKMCYMQNERYLKYFKIYTRINCEIECETNFTLQNCGCATFFHPSNVDFKNYVL